MPKSWQRWVRSLSVSSNVPSSSRNSTRSRADILPSLCWRSRRLAPPPSSASWSRFFSSAIFSSSFIARHYRRARKHWLVTDAQGGVTGERGTGSACHFSSFVLRRSLFAVRCSRGASLASRCCVKKIQKFDLLFWRQEGSFERVAGELAEVIVGKAEVLLNEPVFFDKRRAEHGRVV